MYCVRCFFRGRRSKDGVSEDSASPQKRSPLTSDMTSPKRIDVTAGSTMEIASEKKMVDRLDEGDEGRSLKGVEAPKFAMMSTIPTFTLPTKPQLPTFELTSEIPTFSLHGESESKSNRKSSVASSAAKRRRMRSGESNVSPQKKAKDVTGLNFTFSCILFTVI